MRTNALWMCVVLSGWMTGCLPEVTVAEDARGAEGALGGALGEGGPKDQPGADGIAISRAQLDAYWDGQDLGAGSSTSSGGGSDLNPDDLFLIIGQPVPTCAEPQPLLACGGQWDVSIPLAPAMQAPGVVDLSDPALNAFASETGPMRDDPEDCWWGGGSFVGGTLEVLAIDEAQVVIALEGTGDLNDFDANGEHMLVRCP